MLQREEEFSALPGTMRWFKVSSQPIIWLAEEEGTRTGAVGIQNAVEFHEVPAILFGVTQTTPDDKYEVISLWEGENIYKKLILDGNRIRGMIFVGDISRSGIFASLIRNKIDISNVKDKLLEPDFSYAYFKDMDFGEKSPYLEIPACWDSQNWWAMRASCIYE